MLYTGMGQEMLQMLIPFVQMKSRSMKLPIALESKSTLTEYTSLVSVVLTSIERMIDIPRASRVLTESHLGNLFSHFGFWGCAVLSRVEGKRGSASIGSWISVLISSMSNIANLLTSSNQGTLFAGRAKQNPPPGLNKPLLPLLHSSGPLNLQSIPPFALQLTSRCPNSGSSLSQDGWPFHTDSNLIKVKSMFSELRLCPWAFHQMVQVEVEGVLVERKAELLEESGVQKKGLVEQEQSVQGSRLSTGAWIGTLHLPTASGRSSGLLYTRPPDQCLQVVRRAWWRSDFGHSI